MDRFTFSQNNGGAASIPSWLITIVIISALLVVSVWLLKKYLDRKRQARIFLNNRSVSNIIYNLKGVEFEAWVCQLLLSLGIKAKVVGGQNDHGLDVLAEYQGRKIGIQCKKYYGDKLVGEPIIRDLYGVKWHEKLDKVILITTGNFSPEALKWAEGKDDLAIINAKLLERIILNRDILKQIL